MLPESDLISIVQAYVSVLFEGVDVRVVFGDEVKMNGFELDSHGLLPIWPQLYCLLRSGCSEMELNVFADDILRLTSG